MLKMYSASAYVFLGAVISKQSAQLRLWHAELSFEVLLRNTQTHPQNTQPYTATLSEECNKNVTKKKRMKFLTTFLIQAKIKR